MGFIACLFFHFYSRKGSTDTAASHDDEVQTARSAIKRFPLSKTPERKVEPTFVANKEVSRTPELDSPEEDYEEYAEAETEAQIPWTDIEEGWKSELKNYLLTADPEHAEEIYSAYLEEKKKFAERIDTSESNLNTQGPSFDETGSGEDMEKSHQQSLKELFGEHYSEIQALHREYVESIQYINRSEVPFTIAL